jgi:hypothetical protein
MTALVRQNMLVWCGVALIGCAYPAFNKTEQSEAHRGGTKSTGGKGGAGAGMAGRASAGGPSLGGDSQGSGQAGSGGADAGVGGIAAAGDGSGGYSQGNAGAENGGVGQGKGGGSARPSEGGTTSGPPSAGSSSIIDGGSGGTSTGIAGNATALPRGGTSAAAGAAAMGGTPANGGAAVGGAPSGGTSGSGGMATGGIVANGGTATGGTATGGAATGGAATGGAPTGGAPTGGAPTGGAPTGGAPTGGAPTGGAPCGTETGAIGSVTPSSASSMERVKVTGTDCKQYIIQNNNWGDPTGSFQLIEYTGNAFAIAASSGNGSAAPASFPSVYIGANGDISGGNSTWSDSGLPKQISSIVTAPTSFTWLHGASNGDYATIIDVWFAKSLPTEGSYVDAISGFIQVWLYKPTGRQPLGSAKRTATVSGQAWNVWVSARGAASPGTDGPGRPVVSYVALAGTISSLTFNLKDFIDDAVTNGANDKNGTSGVTQAFSSSWYLTDVFGGFEVWTGSDAVGAQGKLNCVIDP